MTIITLKISGKELGIIIDSLRRYNVLDIASKESMKLLNDMNGIETRIEKEIKEKDKGEK
jgi:hypothetical protein